MLDNNLYFYFTNHRNFLQAVTIGYLCSFDRIKADFSDSIDFPVEDSLCFSKSLFDLPYTFHSDKKLSAVAIGLSEEKLNDLGFKKIEQKDKLGPFFIGYKIIPIELIDSVLFKSREELSNLGRRYGEYLELLEQKKYNISKNEFDDLIQVPAKLDNKIPNNELNHAQEKQISHQIGGMGEYLLHMYNNNETTYLIYSDIVSYYLNNSSSNAPINELKNKIIKVFSNQKISDQELLLMALLFISNSTKDINQQVKKFELFSSNAQIEIDASWDWKSLLRLINVIDDVQFELDDQTKYIDRIDLLTKIQDKFVKQLNDNDSDSSVSLILDQLRDVFNYKIEINEVIESINNMECLLLKQFLRGFECYMRDPTDHEKIKLAVDSEINFPSNLCKVIPEYLWGKSQGAFSLNPKSKKGMLNVIGKRNFYSMALNKEQFEDYRFSMLPEKNYVKNYDIEKISLGGYELCYSVEKPIEHLNYEEVQYLITSSNGIELKIGQEDHYDDARKEIKDWLDDKKIFTDDDLNFLIKELNIFDIYVNFGKEKLKYNKLEKIEDDNKIKISLSGEPDLNIILNNPNLFIEEIKKLLSDRFTGSNYSKVKLSEKKQLRNYFSNIDDPQQSKESSSKKSILTEDKTTTEKKKNPEGKQLSIQDVADKYVEDRLRD